MTAGVVDDDDGDVTTDSHTNQKTLFRRGWGHKGGGYTKFVDAYKRLTNEGA